MKTLPHTMQDMFRETREEYLMKARVVARDLLRTRNWITIEDVHKVYPRPTYLHYNVTGSVFQHPDFHAVGYANSTRPHMHATVIRRWALADDLKVINERDSGL